MRKYEKSLETSELGRQERSKEIQDVSGLLPKGMSLIVFNQRTELVARHDAQRASTTSSSAWRW